MQYIAEIQIDPNPVVTGSQMEVTIELKEVFKDAKKYKGKYGYRYTGNMSAKPRKYPAKYPKRC